MVSVYSTKFYDEYTDTGGGGVNYLLASVGDKMKAIINIGIHWESLNVMLLFDTVKKTIRRTDFQGSFINDGFKIGDTFTIAGTTSNDGTGYVIASVTDTIITTVGALVLTETTTGSIYGTTVVTGIDFYYNLVKNVTNAHFDSDIDIGTMQKFNATVPSACGGVTTETLLPQTNSQAWVNGSVTITNVNCTNYIQQFNITHIFEVTPLFLANQLSLLKAKTLPRDGSIDDTRNGKYVYQIDAKFDNVSPTVDHSSFGNISFNKGLVGWYNEKIGEGTPEFSTSDLAYTDLAGNHITCVDYNAGFKVSVLVHSVNSLFLTGGTNVGTPMVLSHIYLPLKDSDFINTKTNLDQNFLKDRKMIWIGAAAVNGDNFGGALQQLTSIQAAYNTTATCTLTYTYNASATVKAALNAKAIDNRNYLISVTPQDDDVITTATTDRNASIIDCSSYCVNLNDSTLFIIPTQVNFSKFPYTKNYGSMACFDTDTIITDTDFKVKDNYILKSLSIVVEANSATDSFELARKDFNTTILLNCSDVSQIYDYETNGYLLDPADISNQTNLFRVPASDAAGYVFYKLQQGFKCRNEYWFSVDQASNCFVNINKQVWSVYSKMAGYTINYTIYASVEDPTTGNITEFKQVCILKVYDMTDSVDTCVITTSNSGNDLEKNILIDDVTTVIATFTGVGFPSFPAGYSEYYGILYLDYVGGLAIDQTTSEAAPISSSAWSDIVTLTVVNATTITLVADLDYRKLDKNQGGYILKARLGFKV